MPMIVPPGGFAGFAQQVPAVQRKIGGAIRSKGAGGRKKRATRTKKKAVRASGRKRRSGKARLVKGSKAAKAYMAKIRKLRK